MPKDIISDLLLGVLDLGAAENMVTTTPGSFSFVYHVPTDTLTAGKDMKWGVHQRLRSLFLHTHPEAEKGDLPFHWIDGYYTPAFGGIVAVYPRIIAVGGQIDERPPSEVQIHAAAKALGKKVEYQVVLEGKKAQAGQLYDKRSTNLQETVLMEEMNDLYMAVLDAAKRLVELDLADARIVEAIEDDPDKWRKFWNSLTGDYKKKFTHCVKEMEGKVADPKAFCGKLKHMFGEAKDAARVDTALAKIGPTNVGLALALIGLVEQSMNSGKY